MAANPVSRLTEDEYLALEEAAEFRSEFLDGEMLAMSGGSFEHGDLQTNILLELGGKLRGRCRLYASDLRVRVSDQMFAYPDVVVVCGKRVRSKQRGDNLVNPDVIFEILSPSTERYDRGAKFQHYRTIASLKDYILVSQDQARIEHYIRQADDTWTLRDCTGLKAEVKIDSLGVSLPLSAIYDGIELEPMEEGAPAAVPPVPGN
jgi:Uma2 family endonuclease